MAHREDFVSPAGQAAEKVEGADPSGLIPLLRGGMTKNKGRSGTLRLGSGQAVKPRPFKRDLG